MTWYVSSGIRPDQCDKLRAELNRAGIHQLSRGQADTGVGLAILGSISGREIEMVQGLSRGGLRQVLVLLAPSATASVAEASWQLLAAGASDVLAWGKGAAEIAAARIGRWVEVDRIVTSPLVTDNLVGRSTAWVRMLRQMVEVAAFTSAPILMLGESGTGKELLARLIHTLDRRPSKKNLVVTDCTTIVPELSGSELFGHERGAFTNALQARVGAFALADGGTLFLDEIGELPLPIQAQLLRAAQEKTFKRLGSNQWHHTEFRLICATNRNLQAEVEQGSFRRDLYHRLASWTFRIPSLKDRDEDVLLLAEHFLAELTPQAPSIDDPVRHFLRARSYDGNIRDLRQLMVRIAARHVGPGPISIGDIPEEERPERMPSQIGSRRDLESAVTSLVSRGASLKEISREASNIAVKVALAESDGNIQRAARMLQVTDRALQLRTTRNRSSSAPKTIDWGAGLWEQNDQAKQGLGTSKRAERQQSGQLAIM